MKVLDDLDFIGKSRQNDINLDLLKRSVQKETISHAYLFLGNDTEKLYRLALSLSAAITCKDGGCGTCEVCKNMLKGIHADINIIEADGPTLTKDKIIDLQAYLYRSSYGDKKKICIIKEAETLNPTAANKLLKTLEEPPDSSNLIILLAEDSSKLLPTIISRCLVFTWDFDAFESIKEFDFTGIRQVLLGGFKELLLSSDPAYPLDLSFEILKDFDKAYKAIDKNMNSQIKKFEKLGLDKKETKKNSDIIKDRYARTKRRARQLGMDGVFDIISAWLEDIISVKAGAQASTLNYKQEYNTIKDNCEDMDDKDIYSLIDDIDRNRRFLKFSINSEISLDYILLELQGLKTKR